MVRAVLVSLVAAAVDGQDLFLKSRTSPASAPSGFSWGWDDESPLDTYVNRVDPNYGWRDTGARVSMLLGGTGHLLNVTSQQWLDPSRAHLKDGGSIWSHQALTIVPKNMKIRNKGLIYITGGCNENPQVPKAADEEPAAVDAVSDDIGIVAVVLNQIPNCHMVYPSDPEQKPREEDAVIAWAWNMFLETGDPEWLPRLPMVKAAMAGMRAAEEYTKQAGLADIDGWLVAGASKRGWTTWLVGAVNCPSCPKIDAIAPIVPIVPNLREGVHHMWQAYGGFTFAFSDYAAVNFTQRMDDDRTTELLKIVDPISYVDRLERLPKTVLLSAGDEFMMMEWTQNWFDRFTGETHLYIADNAEHSMATGIVGLFRTVSTFANSVFLGGTRPSFSWELDTKAGKITVRVPQEHQDDCKVVLRHAHTLSAKRRDFRLVGAAETREDGTTFCPAPSIGPEKMDGFDICLQPVVWTGTTLNATEPGVYEAQAPRPLIGWTGAYVEVYFPSDTGLKQNYQLTTAGLVYPDTLPFPPCHGEGCVANLL